MLTRRRVLQTTAAALTTGVVSARPAKASSSPVMRVIPSTGEAIPVVGLGSWITFNVGKNKRLLDQSAKVIEAFFAGGGRLIDSSPMYGSAQATIGYALKKTGTFDKVFSADKVWTSSGKSGPQQIEASQQFWSVPSFSLLQVHNLLAWKEHMKTLQAMKAAGTVKYIGVTTSHGRRHADLEKILESEPIDFVQLTYNIIDREVEARLLPLAKERGIAVIVNRPFQRGYLLDQFAGKPLPPWAVEAGMKSWAQYLLKFIVSHPAVTCTIPATTRVDHVRENLAVASGQMPDAELRNRMADYAAGL